MNDQHQVRILIFTCDDPDAVRPIVDVLSPGLGPHCDVVIASAAQGKTPAQKNSFVTARCFPGETAFHLRARIAELSGAAEWIVILEDHNFPGPGWLDALRAEINRLPPSCSALVGSVDNKTSLSPWCWANFIHTFYAHWTPAFSGAISGVLANVAIRRSRLPSRPFTIGELEWAILPGLMTDAARAACFPVDHVQHRTLKSATVSHWCNGRVTGALIAAHVARPRRSAFKHARANLTRRIRAIESALITHPRRSELPPGTLYRVRWLALCHASGALWGSWFGWGRAAYALE